MIRRAQEQIKRRSPEGTAEHVKEIGLYADAPINLPKNSNRGRFSVLFHNKTQEASAQMSVNEYERRMSTFDQLRQSLMSNRRSSKQDQSNSSRHPIVDIKSHVGFGIAADG